MMTFEIFEKIEKLADKLNEDKTVYSREEALAKAKEYAQKLTDFVASLDEITKRKCEFGTTAEIVDCKISTAPRYRVFMINGECDFGTVYFNYIPDKENEQACKLYEEQNKEALSFFQMFFKD